MLYLYVESKETNKPLQKTNSQKNRLDLWLSVAWGGEGKLQEGGQKSTNFHL